MQLRTFATESDQECAHQLCDEIVVLSRSCPVTSTVGGIQWCRNRHSTVACWIACSQGSTRFHLCWASANEAEALWKEQHGAAFRNCSLHAIVPAKVVSEFPLRVSEYAIDGGNNVTLAHLKVYSSDKLQCTSA